MGSGCALPMANFLFDGEVPQAMCHRVVSKARVRREESKWYEDKLSCLCKLVISYIFSMSNPHDLLDRYAKPSQNKFGQTDCKSYIYG